MLLPLQTRFDATPAYEAMERLPLAWWGLLRRKLWEAEAHADGPAGL